MSPSLQSTRPANKACMRLREISSCYCLTLSPPGSCLTRSAYLICGPCTTLLVLGRENEEAPQGQAGDAVAVGVRPRPRAVQLHVQLQQQEERPKARGAAASLFRWVRAIQGGPSGQIVWLGLTMVLAVPILFILFLGCCEIGRNGRAGGQDYLWDITNRSQPDPIIWPRLTTLWRNGKIGM